MTRRIDSKTVCVRCGTWSQVRFRREIGAVPRAEMIDVSVEKLFMLRHFYAYVSLAGELHGVSLRKHPD